MSNGLVTVIVPVCNAESYLEQCLESIIKQSYSNIEILCINDGSVDGSSDILRRYAENDNRVLVINSENKGVSSARNIALDQARGDFVIFVDADDWIDTDTINCVMKEVVISDADVVIFSYISERKRSSSIKHIFKSTQVFEENEVKEKIHRRFVGLQDFELAQPEAADRLSTVWGKLYGKNIIDSSKFTDLNEIGSYEDGLFNLEVFGRVRRAVYLDKPLYHYRRYNESSQTSVYRPSLFDQWQNLFEKMRLFLIENDLYEENSKALENRIALSIIGLGFNIDGSRMSFIEKSRAISNILKSDIYKNAVSQLPLRCFPLHWAVFFGCAKYKLSCVLLFMIELIKFLRGI